MQPKACGGVHVERAVDAPRLESRNGTMVGSEGVRGDWLLKPGNVIRIGQPNWCSFTKCPMRSPRRATAVRNPAIVARAHARRLPTTTPTCSRRANRQRSRIVAGRRNSLLPAKQEKSGVSKIGRAAAKLCRLAFELAKAPDVAAMAELALAGLAEGTQSDAGALLLLSANRRANRRAKIWKSSPPEVPPRIITTAFRISWPPPSCAKARRCWPATSSTTARLGTRDSRGEILATSVICPGPPRRQVFGLIHLYSTTARWCPIPTIWSSRWPWPTRWRWPSKTSAAGRNWPRT